MADMKMTRGSFGDMRINKDSVKVSVVLNDGSNLEGEVFIGEDERVSDMLNTERMFFPLQLATGEMLLINKTTIALCKTQASYDA